MHTYLSWNETTLTDITPTLVTSMYDQGYVFTRKEKGNMNQTRSIRIHLPSYTPSSENKRILKKIESVSITSETIPYTKYDWNIGKCGKDFYSSKFGEHTFSANKIKELLTTEHNFTTLLRYHINQEDIGYAICYENDTIRHYSYPFYSLTQTAVSSLGMGMMVRAIDDAVQKGYTYVYLGSAQRPTDTYKLQFSGLEWFDGTTWQQDDTTLKQILMNTEL